MTENGNSVQAERNAHYAMPLVQEGAELKPKQRADFRHARLRLGIDVGSTTVKLAVIDENEHLVYANYERHHTDVKATAREVFRKAEKVLGDAKMRVSITGSGGMLLAQVARCRVRPGGHRLEACRRVPDSARRTVAIELGGEDAKIIYFDNGIEQRMNGTCAGGTGAFIDQMASLMETDATGLNDLAKGATHIYPIAIPLRRLCEVRRAAAPQ